MKSKLDISFLGHILEGQLMAVVAMLSIVLGLRWAAIDAYALTGLIPIIYFWGREKRDWETGTKAAAGVVQGHLLFLFRWSNFTDFIGNVIVYAAVMAARHFFF